MQKIATLAAALLLVAVAAGADEATDLARRHYEAGSAYFEEGRFDDAVREFRESHRLSPRVDLLYNIAKCYEHKGDAARAAGFYRQYLAGKPAARDRPEIEAALKLLDARVGRVTVADAPAGAEVLIDGAPVGTAPLAGAVTATAGERLVEARPVDGGAVRRVTVTVPAGGEVVAKLPPPPMLVKEVVKEVRVEGPRWYTSRPGWILGGGGAALAVTGAVLLGLARPTQDDAARAGTEAAWRDAEARASLYQGLGIGLLAAGAALVATGVVLFVLRTRGEARPPAVGRADGGRLF